MRNALFNTASMKTKQAFTNDGGMMSWKFVEEIFQVDCQHASPVMSLTNAAVFPDGWSKMNVSAAKAPFAFNTITQMMVNIAIDMDCAEDLFMNDISNDDIPMIYKNRLAMLMTYHMIERNLTVETKIHTVEYIIHVAIIFNEMLLN